MVLAIIKFTHSVKVLENSRVGNINRTDFSFDFSCKVGFSSAIINKLTVFYLYINSLNCFYTFLIVI